MKYEGIIRPVDSASALTFFIRYITDGLLVSEGIIRPVVSPSALTCFIRYKYY
jgi:hypothetical protein